MSRCQVDVENAHGDVVSLPTMSVSVTLGAMSVQHKRIGLLCRSPTATIISTLRMRNLLLQNLWDGVGTMAALLEME
jgi:hypothetical protein